METDVAILGGGAAGLSAAREARRRGGSAVLVNRGPLGGDCTFTGCVPSKSVIEASRAGIGFADAFERARAVVDHIASTESAERLTEEGIKVMDAEGRLVMVAGSPAIAVDGRIIKARGVVLALGSRPFVPPIPGLEQIDALTTDSLWELKTAPESMAVIGGGAVGAELSQALAGLGVSVTLIEMASRILGNEEEAASAVALDGLVAAGVEVLTNSTVVSVEPEGERARVNLSGGDHRFVERVFVATGRKPNSDRGGLLDAGLDIDDRGFVVNSDDLRTSVGGVYVAGDLAGRLQLTHAADHMGRMASANILGRFGRIRPQRFVTNQIPRVTFVSPEIASIGPSEAAAARSMAGAMVAELPLAEHDRALVAEKTKGFIKIIAAPRPVIGMTGGGRVIGATIVAERAGEMMAEIALAVRLGAFTGRLVQTVHAYPTWSYGVAKAAGQFFTTVEGRTARPAGEESTMGFG